VNVPPTVTLAIPTWGRDEVLVTTLRNCLLLAPRADELLIVDQTAEHAPDAERALAELAQAGILRRLRQAEPSIPAAMNRALREATGAVVLFVDDDVVPAPDLVGAHRAAHAAGRGPVVAGQVLQPGEAPEPLAGATFAFRSSLPQEVAELMGGNFSVARAFALALGGFDENFVGAAYRFEADFALRARAASARIRFEPAASLRHLRAPHGGTRAYGDHRRTSGPEHAVGEYYFLMRHRIPGWRRRTAHRLLTAWWTRAHARHPWWIPRTLVAELRGLLLARRLHARGPRLLPAESRSDG
jgi:GT2 family glycosyltransferase